MALTAPTQGPVSPPTELVTVADLALLVGMAADDQMQRSLTVALGHVARRCGPLVGGQYSWPLQQNDSGAILLPVRGETLASIDTLVGSDDIDYIADSCVRVDWSAAIIWTRLPYRHTRMWQVTATLASSDERSASLAEAVLLIGKQLQQARRGKAARPQVYGEDDVSVGFMVPKRASIAMAPYLLTTV